MIYLHPDVRVRDSNAGGGYNWGKLVMLSRKDNVDSSVLCLLPTEEETTGIYGTNSEEIKKKLVHIAASDSTVCVI